MKDPGLETNAMYYLVGDGIASLAAAAYGLLGLDRKVPDVYKGHRNPRVLLNAFLALHGRESSKESMMSGA